MKARLARERREFQFVEIPTDPEKLAQISDASDRTSPSYEEMLEQHEERTAREARWDRVLKAVKTAKLTDRQLQIVYLHFFEGKTEEQIAQALGIRQQTVSEYLFGKVEKGKRVGGAIARIKAVMLGATPCKKTHK